LTVASLSYSARSFLRERLIGAFGEKGARVQIRSEVQTQRAEDRACACGICNPRGSLREIGGLLGTIIWQHIVFAIKHLAHNLAELHRCVI